MKKLIILIIFTISIISCEEKDIENEKTILTCELVNSLNIEIKVIENNGITATIDVSDYKFVNSFNEITFVYKLQNDSNEFSVRQKLSYSEGKLTAQINENLIKEQFYEIKAVLDINGENCSTKSVLFKSQGSSVIDYKPIICEMFSELIPDINESNEGVNINIYLPLYYSFNNQQSYGFEYNITESWETNTIPLSNELDISSFNTIMDENFICGLSYEIRGFVLINGEKCYSKKALFHSSYSKIPSPWCATYSRERGFDRTYGTSIKGKSYILYQNDAFYEINNESVLKPLKPFPLDGDTGVKYSIFSIENYGYFKSSNSRDLFRYNSETDEWTNLGNTGLKLYVQYYGGQLNGTGYFFDSNASYKYNQNTNTFNLLSEYQETRFINCFQTNSKIYVINSNYEILEFDEIDGSWKTITTFPGNKSDGIVSFVRNNKVIIGLSHRSHSPGKITHYDLHELNLDSKEWKELISFPYPFRDSFGISSTSSNEFNYIVYRTFGYTMVWEFDYNKIEYK